MGLSQSNPDGGRSDTRTQDEREEEKKEIKNNTAAQTWYWLTLNK